jgi:hypothetical protein
MCICSTKEPLLSDVRATSNCRREPQRISARTASSLVVQYGMVVSSSNTPNEYSAERIADDDMPLHYICYVLQYVLDSKVV